MSVKRKNIQIFDGLKLTGIKSVDDCFNQAISPLAILTEMRGILESTLIKWRSDCGIGSSGTIRKGLRLMLARAKTATMNTISPDLPHGSHHPIELMNNLPSFAICSDEKTYPMIVTNGAFPVQLQKTFDSMSELLNICAKILDNIDSLLTKLETVTKCIIECSGELSQLCLNAGLHGVKAIRAMENFAWNVRILKIHLTLIYKAQIEANNIVTEVFDVACTLRVLSKKSTKKIRGNRHSC
ncbi:unnamed protein product [Cercopithifilaria johnstoni]|uniref:Uncharacterized protein n=1 Tax=Cercopithifilaria johnstoni TaxID=2874296 RepID=A0A8J2Q8U7_9BILA|nr:unnamed protein product [Cercopithifilaria johnstoni]